MALRTGFGTGTYGVHLYGYPEVWEGSATASCAASVTVNGAFVKQASATATVTASATASLSRRRIGYGSGPYGIDQYGYPEIWEDAVAISVTSSITQADGERVRTAAASTSASASATVSAQRIQQPTATASCTVTGSAQGFMSVVGSSLTGIISSTGVQYVRIRPFAASDQVLSSITDSDCRYKWIPVTGPSDTWTEASYRGD